MSMFGKRWMTWEDFRAEREKIRKQSGLTGPRFQIADLMAKAVVVAQEIFQYEFVLHVGLFGSAARGENGNDVDLLIFDDGTVSNRALSLLCTIDSFNNGRRDPWYQRYAYICRSTFAEHMLGGENCRLYKYLLEPPEAVDLIFVNALIQRNQAYLDNIVLNSGGDPLFFRNLQNDALLFHPDVGFRRSDDFPRFVNGGMLSFDILQRILNEMSGFGNEKRIPKFGNNGHKDDFANYISEIRSKESSLCKENPVICESVPENVSFKSIGGQVKAKDEMMKLSAALNHPAIYGKWGTRPPRGVCLYGPPGNGKTLMARALAAETKVPFYLMDASKIVDMWYGNSERNVDSLFDKARATGGIIFIDEADSLASSRSTPGAHEASKRVVAALCRNMDGFDSLDRVVVIFATNRPEDIDKAVGRAGRIDRDIEVPLPDREGRKQIFEIHIERAERIAGRKLFEGLGMESIVSQTENYGGADIAEIVRRTLEAKVIEEDRGEIPGLVTSEDILEEIDSYEKVKKAKEPKIGLKR